MMQRLISVGSAIFSISLFAVSCVELSTRQLSSFTPMQMREDLIFLRDTWAPMDKTFSSEEQRVFESIIETSITNADTLSPAEFALEIARAVSVSDNGHTEANPYGYLSFLPIRVWWFSDGLYIVEAEPDQETLLGFRIDRIGDMSAEQALSMVSPFISGTMERIRFLSTGHLVSPESLHHAGVIPSIDEVKLSLTNIEGESRVVTLTKQRSSRRSTSGISIPIPSRQEAIDRWSHVLDSAPEISPAFRPPLVDVAHEWMVGNTVLYIRSNAIGSIDDKSLHDKLIGLLFQAYSEMNLQFVIVDLRLNNGGNYFNSIVFSQMLPHIVPEDGRIFVLIGHGTYSAAIATAAMLKVNGEDKVLFVGERMGDGPQHWAEGRQISLPHSQIPVKPANGYHDWSGGCEELPECFLPTAVYARQGVTLEPDVQVTMSFEDYARGYDHVLETALSLARTD